MSAAKLLGRRAALRLGFGAAAAAPMALQAAAAELGQIGGAAMLGGSGMLSVPQAAPPPGSSLGFISQGARLLYRQRQRQHERIRRYRIGAFDIDIAGCGSWSLAKKIDAQRTRDEEADSLLRRLGKEAFGWSDEDM